MPLDGTIITDAMAYIRANPKLPVDAQEAYLANAFETFVKGATITYSAGLIAPSGGGPVTGVLGNTIA